MQRRTSRDWFELGRQIREQWTGRESEERKRKLQEDESRLEMLKLQEKALKSNIDLSQAQEARSAEQSQFQQAMQLWQAGHQSAQSEYERTRGKPAQRLRTDVGEEGHPVPHAPVQFPGFKHGEFEIPGSAHRPETLEDIMHRTTRMRSAQEDVTVPEGMDLPGEGQTLMPEIFRAMMGREDFATQTEAQKEMEKQRQRGQVELETMRQKGAEDRTKMQHLSRWLLGKQEAGGDFRSDVRRVLRGGAGQQPGAPQVPAPAPGVRPVEPTKPHIERGNGRAPDDAILQRYLVRAGWDRDEALRLLEEDGWALEEDEEEWNE